MNSLNVDSLLRDTFPLWWLGAIVLVLVLAFGLVYRKAWWPQVAVGVVGYSILCLCIALTLYTKHFFDQTDLLPYALAMIAAVAFLLASYWKQPKILLQLSGFIVKSRHSPPATDSWCHKGEPRGKFLLIQLNN
jgi:hypothetical protein